MLKRRVKRTFRAPVAQGAAQPPGSGRRPRLSAPTGSSWGSASERAYDGSYLLGDSNKQSACQSVIFTGERRIIGVVFSAKYGGLPSIGVFVD